VAQQDAVLVGAGDIASCDDVAGARATAKLIDNIRTVFAAGDWAHPDGSDEQFAKCYGPTRGRFKDRTRPAARNHEYPTFPALIRFRDHPHRGTAGHGNDPEFKPLWDALYSPGAEVVSDGHDHDYERFAPQDHQGNLILSVAYGNS
jgi:hypothetical protein